MILHQRLRTALRLAVTTALVPLVVSVAPEAKAAGASFATLQSPFTQELYGVAGHFFGGVAFAPDGDPLVDSCAFSGSALTRFDTSTTLPTVNGTSTLHPTTTLPSNAGCGLTNHPNGSLYSNTGGGVTRLDANTGAQIGSVFGPAGNALGITPDPVTGNLVYVGSDGTLLQVNPGLTTSSTFSAALTGHFLDGIYFDPSGNFLFTADRAGGSGYALTIINRAGAIVRSVAVTSEPDGIAFKAVAPKFVVANNTDGTMTRFDFPADDYTQAPTVSQFAAGGFRGDLTQVGPDACLYVTQAGARYDDSTTDGNNSLVRICPGFAPPPGVGTPGACAPPFTPTATINTNQPGNVTVSGKTLIDGVTIGGNVVVYAGGEVFIRNSIVNGSVTSNNAASVGVVGSTVKNSAIVNRTTGTTAIGRSDGSCTGNKLGTTSVDTNTGPVQVVNNTVNGNLSATNNTGGTTISGNNVSYRLACSGNSPAPTNGGVVNTALARTGQCASPSF